MINQRSTEKKLSIAYTLCAVFGVTSAITAGIAYGHWKETLDQCGFLPERKNCSCILYGRNTLTYFAGGSNHICNWVTFGPILYILFSIGLACFHGFRVLFGSTGAERKIITKNSAGETIVLQAMETNDTSLLSRAFWIIKSVIAAFLMIYALVHFSIFMDGFLRTCSEYRKMLEKLLGLHGTVIPVVHNRLTCNAVFDFMDYIQPDTAISYRQGIINTAADLIIGLLCSFFAWILFVCATIWSIRQARVKNDT